LKPFLRQQLERFPVRLQELDFFLQQPEVVQDMERFRALTREHAEVSAVAGLFARLRELEAQLASSRELLEDPDMAEMARRKSRRSRPSCPALEDELQKLLLPKDPDDVRNTSWKSGPAPAATSRPCSRATCCACTRATPSARAGAASW
jgi:peptide chain release factor 1